MRRITPLVLSLALVTFSACSSDSSSSPDTTAPSAFCADRTALETAVSGLKDFDTSTGVAGLTDSLKTVRADLAALRESGGEELKDEIDAVSAAIDTAETNVGAASGPAAVAAAIVTSLGEVATSLKALSTAASSIKCP
jgi:hypothetical protein